MNEAVDIGLGSPALRAAFDESERKERVNTGKVASALVVFLMPVGITLDLLVYPEMAVPFLGIRLLCSALAGVLWYLHTLPLAERHYLQLSAPIALLPAVSITAMIYLTEGAASSYYAGLNLILLAVSVVVHWSVRESFYTVSAVVLIYVLACSLHGLSGQVDLLFNNLYFLLLTGVIVVTGNHFYNRLRLREFSLRFELERNRRVIEENNRKLIELDQIKSRFFANISHELRTPLTLMLAPLDALRIRFGGLLDTEGRELITTMRDNGMRLLKLINDLLDLVRLEEGRIKIERAPVNLETFVRGVTSSVQHTATTRKVRLWVDVDPGLPAVLVDRDKVEKILLNLLFNALKFTDAGGEVGLRVAREDSDLVFSVSDTGIGISELHLGQLFQRFWQADASSHRKHQGAGIGLALVKEFTEAQGGSVGVQSEEGRGTTFTVRLPLVEATGSEASAAAEAPEPGGPSRDGNGDGDSWLQGLYREAQLSPAGGGRMGGSTALYARSGLKPSTVLVADDEPDMLRFIRAQLGSEHRIVSARNGREAVDMARGENPSVIVLDMMMPEMDGIEACSELRKEPATAHIPVIMLTARADEETKLAALAAGANDFLAKPFSVTELHVRVLNLMESHYSRMELAKQNQTLEDTLEMLRETEMQLLQSEKLASIGELSAGMSHEVRNPLNYVLTSIYALRNRVAGLPEGERSEYEGLVASMEEGVRRVMETVNALRELVHPQVENREPFEVRDVVDAALRLLRAEWKGRVEVHIDIARGTALYANKSMVLLVFLNLLKNALDALRERAEGDGGAALWIEGCEEEARTLVRVRDNGPGIPEQNQSRVFDILGMGDLSGDGGSVESEPEGRVFKHFFSTKAPGAGMGMGLSICRRIVRAHGGRISFRTEPGAMCEFILEFPTRKAAEAMV